MTLRSAVTALLAVAFLGATSAWANEVEPSGSRVNEWDERYLTIGDAKIVEVLAAGGGSGLDLPLPTEPPGSGIPPLDEAEVILDRIINMGKKIWKIIEANRPVVDYRSDTANALPQGAVAWQQLESWDAPRARIFKVAYENLYGSEVVTFKFRVLYTANGRVNGKGRYLTNVTIVPHELNVAWGYTFNAQGTVPSVVNAGTSREPVAAMELLMKWSVDTVLRHSESSASFYVRGDGEFLNLTDGN